jgi:hypothetical protein
MDPVTTDIITGFVLSLFGPVAVGLLVFMTVYLLLDLFGLWLEDFLNNFQFNPDWNKWDK